MASSGETLLFDKSMYPEVEGCKSNGENQQSAFWVVEQDGYHTLFIFHSTCVYISTSLSLHNSHHNSN